LQELPAGIAGMGTLLTPVVGGWPPGCIWARSPVSLKPREWCWFFSGWRGSAGFRSGKAGIEGKINETDNYAADL
jgi:hypothetical protein